MNVPGISQAGSRSLIGPATGDGNQAEKPCGRHGGREENGLAPIPPGRFKSMRGQTLLEFAFVLPMALMLIFAVVDFGHLFYVQMMTQNAVQQAGRYAVTGNHMSDPNNPGQNLSRVASIIQVAEQAAPGVNFSGISISSQHGGSGNAGGPGDIVTVSLSTSMQLITPLIGRFFPNGTYNFTVSSTFMNEPFPPGNTK
jgi:Flp pilus assembly protein TadG